MRHQRTGAGRQFDLRAKAPPIGLVLMVAFALLVTGCGSSVVTTPSTTAAADSSTTTSTAGSSGSDDPLSQVAAAVEAAAKIQMLPSNTQPPLQDVANDDFPSSPAAHACPPGSLGPANAASAPCAFGDPAGSRTIVLVGDSHAQMWEPAIDTIATQLQSKLLMMSKPSCPFATLSYFSRSSSTPWSPTPQCVSWQKNVMATIKTVRPSILIMISDHYGYTSDWYAALRSMVTKVSPFAGKVVVIGQIPNLQNGTAACLARHASNIQLCSSPASQAIQTGYIAAEKQAAGETGATYVDLTPWFCTSTCTALIHKTVVYYDRAHITLSFGSYLEPALYQTLRNANVFTSAPG